jgi:hypothetical protein
VAWGLRQIVRRPWVLALLINALLFAFGLLLCRSSGEEWVDLLDLYISNFLMTSIGLLQFVVVAWVFGMRDYAALVRFRLGLDLGIYFTIVWRFVGPFLMAIMLIAGIAGALSNPVTDVPWAAALGWMIGVVPVVLVLISFCVIEDRQGQTVISRYRNGCSQRNPEAASVAYPTLSATVDEASPEEEAGARAGTELLQRNEQRSEPGSAVYETRQLDPASPPSAALPEHMHATGGPQPDEAAELPPPGAAATQGPGEETSGKGGG